MIDLSREGDVFVLRADAGENRFNPETLRGWNQALDQVEAAQGPKFRLCLDLLRWDQEPLQAGQWQDQVVATKWAIFCRLQTRIRKPGEVWFLYDRPGIRPAAEKYRVGR